MRPTIGLMPKNSEVQKVPKIQIVALCYILLSLLIGYERDALL